MVVVVVVLVLELIDLLGAMIAFHVLGPRDDGEQILVQLALDQRTCGLNKQPSTPFLCRRRACGLNKL